MAKKWNFMKANGVYVYPSANADDGGDVNSEVNVSGISQHLIQKNFIIDNGKSKPRPLEVQVDKNSNFNVYHGSCILDGYYINLTSKTDVYVIKSQEISTAYLNNSAEFFIGTEPDGSDGFNSIYDKYYTVENGKVVPKIHVKKGASIPKLPKLHLVIKLVKDITGNLRGDLLERKTTGSNILLCRACAWSILTSKELAKLDVPYIEIAQFIPNKITNPKYTGKITIKEVINPDDRSSYIDIDSIFDENGNTLSQIIENRIKEGMDALPTITHYSYDEDDTNHTGPRIKDLVITVKNGVPEIIRYHKKNPAEYDENGDYVVEPDNNNNYDSSYSIDDIQQRTHVASYADENHTDINELANIIDALDSGFGGYKLDNVNGWSSDHTYNGKSRLLAHADHTHDERYLNTGTYSADPDQEKTQTVNTNVDFVKKVTSHEFQNGNLSVNSDGDIDNGVLKTDRSKNGKNTITPEECAAQVSGSMNVSGYISATRVYNAVWNDYAELMKKDNENDILDEGTVICKVPGKDAYSASDFQRKRLVVGVVTERYGHLLGGDSELSLEDNLQKYVPVSLAGRVPVKVVPNVPIEEGDLLTVSIVKGRATSDPYPEQGTVIGKALESTDGTKDKILMQIALM